MSQPDVPQRGPAVFAEAPLGPIRLKNRIIKAATFEGRSPRGAVTDDLIAFHVAMARGGVAMTTVAYLAVAPEGRTDRHCIVLGDAALDGELRGIFVGHVLPRRRNTWSRGDGWMKRRSVRGGTAKQVKQRAGTCTRGSSAARMAKGYAENGL